jgi:NAD(P) transhydrogenase subunit alpha
MMKLFVPLESEAGETRVAMSPEVVKKLTGLGFEVVVERGAGHLSRIPDSAFMDAGASIGEAGDIGAADVIFKVRRPTPLEATTYKNDALVLASMDPYGNEADIEAMAKAGISGFSMEFMPRITRAQVMDVLSSQANLAGYQAVIEASAVYDRALPMMMTAAGTVPAAKVFVMGAGVAGLQAIATARRLGAIVTATDVRPAAKEQVESLGAKFIAVEDEEFKQAETSAGYAKEMSKEYQAKQAELVANHIARQDIVITTALIPGRPAPRLVSGEMIDKMAPGSVLVDLAVERGGNVEGAIAGEIAKIGDVRVVGYLNMAGRIGASASLLYAKNLYAFLETMVDKETKSMNVDWDDELVKATLLTRGGAIVHPAFAPEIAVVEDADGGENSDVVEDTDGIEKADLAENTDAVENIEPEENTDAAENTEPVENTDAIEDTDTVEDTYAVEDTDPLENSDHVENTGVVDDADLVAETGPAENTEVFDELTKQMEDELVDRLPEQIEVEAAAEEEANSTVEETQFDDLTRIDGIGPYNARKLEEMGITSFAQIADWSSDEEETIGDQLDFPGRIESEKWVEQAKNILSDGGS